MVSKMEAITSRLSKIRDQFQDDLKNSRNELTLKIEETDKFFNE